MRAMEWGHCPSAMTPFRDKAAEDGWMDGPYRFWNSIFCHSMSFFHSSKVMPKHIL